MTKKRDNGIIFFGSMDEFMEALFPEHQKRRKDGHCPECGKPVKEEDMRDPLSAKEFKISGLCQECQDGVFQV